MKLTPLPCDVGEASKMSEPVRTVDDANGSPVAAVAIAGPSFRLSHERMLLLGQSIQATTDAIAREVGLVGLSAIVPKSATPGVAGQNK
jgi:hypothetical protein